MNGQAKLSGGKVWRTAGWGGAILLLLLPLAAMQFTNEVNWTASDFIFAAMLFALVGGGFELLARRSRTLSYRAAAALGLLAIFLLVWINGAVGIIGDEDNPANLMFAGVIATAIVGAAIARLRPMGMAAAMLAAAAAQVIVCVVALVGSSGAGGPIWPLDLIGATGFLTALWLTAAALFRHAAKDRAAVA